MKRVVLFSIMGIFLFMGFTGCVPKKNKPDASCDMAQLKHGTVSWYELMTKDVAAAKKFYSKVFGWETKTDKCPVTGMYYTVASCDGKPAAGMMAMSPMAKKKRIPPNWGIYITVDDIEATVKLVKKLGGKVILGPQSAGEIGTFAVIQDPQEAFSSIMQYKK